MNETLKNYIELLRGASDEQIAIHLKRLIHETAVETAKQLQAAA